MKQLSATSRHIAWMMWVIASVFYAYQYILRVMPNIMLEDIMHQFGINALTFGQFSGVYYIGYSLMHLPIGIMLDRFGPKKVMTGCILLTVAGMMPLIFAHHWAYPIIGRFLIGLGSSAAILGVFKIIRMIFEEGKFARMLSLSVTIGLVGAIYGGGPVSYMRDIMGYRVTVEFLAVLGGVLALLTYLVIPHVETASQGTVFSDIKEVFTNKRVLAICFLAGLMVGPLEGFADVWASAFLKQSYGFEATLAATIPSMIFIGMCFGSPVLTFIADKMKNYFTTIAISAALMALFFFGILFTVLSSTLLSVGFVIVGICSAYQILAIYKASTYVREGLVGLTTAVSNMIIMTFGYAFHAIIGTVVNAMGGPEAPYALAYGVTVIPIALTIGFFGFTYLASKEPAAVRSQKARLNKNDKIVSINKI